MNAIRTIDYMLDIMGRFFLQLRMKKVRFLQTFKGMNKFFCRAELAQNISSMVASGRDHILDFKAPISQSNPKLRAN
jgi:hypothetical protein